MKQNQAPKPAREPSGGFYRVCDRCLRDTDAGIEVTTFTECPTCGPIWLCEACTNVHRDELALFGGTG